MNAGNAIAGPKPHVVRAWPAPVPMAQEDWYHATPAGERAGPMTADDLVRLYQAGRIGPATPVWQRGMATWASLSTVAPSLGLTLPPTLPPPLPASPVPGARGGRQWIWLTLLVVAGAGIPLVLLLTAIARPAYADYRHRSGVADVISAAAPLRSVLAETAAGAGACPVTATGAQAAGVPAPLDAALSTLRAHPHVKYALTTEGGSPDACVLRVGLRGFGRKGLDDRALSWALDPASGTWTCRASVANRYLPSDCRG